MFTFPLLIFRFRFLWFWGLFNDLRMSGILGHSGTRAVGLLEKCVNVKVLCSTAHAPVEYSQHSAQRTPQKLKMSNINV